MNGCVLVSDHLRIGIVLPANLLGGPQKIAAIAALDLAKNGHEVTIILPLAPYFYYHVSLGRNLLRWVRQSIGHFRDWLKNPRFVFEELLLDSSVEFPIRTRFVLRKSSRRALSKFDRVVVHSIAQVNEYARVYPQENQIYLLWHPEEHVHGYDQIFQQLRREFKGKIVLSSSFTEDAVRDHVTDWSLIPGPISHLAWGYRGLKDESNRTRDILLFWKHYKDGPLGGDILLELLKKRPQTTISIWCRGTENRIEAMRLFPNVEIVEAISEQELCDLYLDHKMLLFASTYEGLGVPPIEALACRCIPILYPNVGAADIYAKDGENCIHLSEESSDTISRIAEVLDNEDLLRAMRLDAPNHIEPFDPHGYGMKVIG